ncbi:SDR family NAD(P)-dependent oxidoreductase [Cohnella herbarum]|uniref:3-oxoacyl-ACP reductase FabG n=1 Tax=Cohnella herbarum TaxID=2728023 RepID=A0A7Z2VM98_9BACL|nr:3-oxoacyl-ACP reductase family protein [Cohnella herbarum]QJD85863.1 3-oxoacyl-ACP reductase FabG [Cohnella herbarum]
MRLSGQTAIVTGAARSIGASIAKRFAREGAKVAIVDVANPELAEQVVAEIVQAGGEAMFVRADVSRRADVEAMVQAVASRFGPVDILVNNAGIDPRKNWLEITEEDWDHIMGVNVRSQFLCSQAVFPYMKERGRGKIVNVSSVTFLTGQRNLLHYVSSKGAVIGFTRALAREVGAHGITVNCLMPGAVLTETELARFSEAELAASATMLAAAQCFSRRENAYDLEGAFVFLASEDSDFITGQTLNVDGGWMFH